MGTERGRSARHFASEAEEFCQCFRPHHDGQGIREVDSDNPSDHPFLESLPQWGVTRFLLQHHLACPSSYSGNSQRPYSVPTQDSTLLRNQYVFELTPQALAVQTPEGTSQIPGVNCSLYLLSGSGFSHKRKGNSLRILVWFLTQSANPM